MEWEDLLAYIREWALGYISTSRLRTALLEYKDSDESHQIVADTLIEHLL